MRDGEGSGTFAILDPEADRGTVGVLFFAGPLPAVPLG